MRMGKKWASLAVLVGVLVSFGAGCGSELELEEEIVEESGDALTYCPTISSIIARAKCTYFPAPTSSCNADMMRIYATIKWDNKAETQCSAYLGCTAAPASAIGFTHSGYCSYGTCYGYASGGVQCSLDTGY
jgi:hypothetical protein